MYFIVLFYYTKYEVLIEIKYELFTIQKPHQFYLYMFYPLPLSLHICKHTIFIVLIHNYYLRLNVYIYLPHF